MNKTAVIALPPPSVQQRVNEAIRNDYPKLFAFIRRRVPTPADAEDILQDVFATLAESMPGAQKIQSMSAWLYRVARNRITDWFRKKKPLSIEDMYAHHTDEEGHSESALNLITARMLDTEDEMLRKNLYRAIMDALDHLPEEQRRVFVAQELEGKSFKEIAAETGEKIPTLISRKRYAVLAMRKELQNLYDELNA